jgi:hypothetical protein
VISKGYRDFFVTVVPVYNMRRVSARRFAQT